MTQAWHWTLAGIVAASAGNLARAQMTEIASVATGGTQGNYQSTRSSISADGRFVIFRSSATNLVTSDTNATWDVFVRARQGGTTERVSVTNTGAQAAASSALYAVSISGDGRYAAFDSLATTLVTGDTNSNFDVFVRDRANGTTERVSVGPAGVEGNGASTVCGISADGRYVAFESFASNLVAGDTNLTWDIFVRDRTSGTTERVSLGAGGAEGNGASGHPAISADGRYVAFHSAATNLVAGDTNLMSDVFLRDRQLGTTERVSVGTGGAQGNLASLWASVSADGRYVAFQSAASNLVSGDTNLVWDSFVRDRQSGITERVSVATGGAEGNGASGDASYSPDGPWISADGRYVTFTSFATNLVPGDTNLMADAFVRDRQAATTSRVSVSTSGAQASSSSTDASISADGRYVAFESSASNLAASDTNGTDDAFVRDRGVSSFTSLCFPGLSGVMSCPCGNPPSASGRGCDNTNGTGGAVLAAGGTASLATDSLSFSTSGEMPTAPSILMQGTLQVTGGAVFGQGVRCAGGTLARLYVKAASNGSITAPDLLAGNPTVSVRSAALGDTIQSGQSRWYQVYYRDPTVPTGCSAASTYNTSQTVRVDWGP
jgi:Tol biopolymer transport system component